MSTSITFSGGPAIVPDIVVLGSTDAERTGRSLTHDILDGAPVHTLRPARPKAGILTFSFYSSAEANNVAELLAAAAVYTITSTDDATLNFRFIVDRTSVAQDRETAALWNVTVNYAAVT